MVTLGAARALTLRQWREATSLEAFDADVATIQYGYGITKDEAAEWLDGHSVKAAFDAIRKVMEASDLVEGASFPDAPEHDAGGERP